MRSLPSVALACALVLGVPSARSDGPDTGTLTVVLPASARYRSLRQVPWRNARYRVFGPGVEGAFEQVIRVRAGRYEQTRWGFWFGVRIGPVAYGDLIGDGREDAIVNAVQAGEGIDDHAQWLYELRDGRPVPVASIRHSHIREMRIEDRSLVLWTEHWVAGDGDRPSSDGRSVWRWNGTTLVEDESMRTFRPARLGPRTW